MQEAPSKLKSRSRRWKHIPLDWRRPDASAAYDVLWDEDAGLGTLFPFPDANEVKAFYQVDDYYTHSASRASASTRSIGQRALVHLAWMCDQGKDLDTTWWQARLGQKPIKVLEIGCGNGGQLDTLRKLGHTVVGVEPDPMALAVALSKGHVVHAGIAEELPEAVQSERFDAVIFLHVLEHCLDPDAALKAAADLLNDNGLLIAEVPNNLCRGAEYFGAAWLWLDVPRHLTFFTPKSLEALCKACELRVTETSFYGYCRQFQPSWTDVQASIARLMRLGNHVRYTLLGHTWYLGKTCFAPANLKYDSVRVVARKVAKTSAVG